MRTTNASPGAHFLETIAHILYPYFIIVRDIIDHYPYHTNISSYNIYNKGKSINNATNNRKKRKKEED